MIKKDIITKLSSVLRQNAMRCDGIIFVILQRNNNNAE
jgi:hypothetical protein